MGDDLPDQSKNEELQDEESFAYAIQLCNSVVLSMALQSATELGVFEVLQKAGTDVKLSADEIASRLSCTNPDASKMLDRILALLASHSVINCSVLPDQHNFGSFHRFYTMAPVAKFFAPNSDGVSLGPLIALHHDKIFLDSWSQLKDAIREGGVPFNRVHGTHAFEYPSLDSRFNQVFNTAMINHTTIVMKKVLECYKGFDEVKRLVDVGGGLGVNINLITSKYPHIQGINFDLPHVIQHAPSYPGIEHVGGDMFESVPKADAIFMKATGFPNTLLVNRSADCQLKEKRGSKDYSFCLRFTLAVIIGKFREYGCFLKLPFSPMPAVGVDKLLKVACAVAPHWILHDWSDEQCLKLLKNCYDAIPDDGKVIVLEAVLSIIPENNAAWKFAAQSDVLMMTQNPGGKERTEQEFMDLANGAGFSGIRYECYVHTFWVMEFFK
ncbi:caffeic acid 3-O-methyltransferase [Trifolium pratense]|uniref:Caffeic acid 3-O-methyltransferase n=1 Tax=Trifolium pratense TaxID=57577 RepID=A0A2K3N199_TRIPR|nr:caffeic acid 3-O-methyltransferase [Trifolium pratense]